MILSEQKNIERRIVILMAGYNKKKNKHNNRRIKKIYKETSIDYDNKVAIVLDEITDRQAIEYPLNAFEQLGNTQVIIPGDKKSLEEIIAKQSWNCIKKEDILEQENSFYENLKIGEERWFKKYNELLLKGYKVSPHVFFIFGDSFMADSISLDYTFRAIETRDADISFTYCKEDKHKKNSRQFFLYRSNLFLQEDIAFRNANVGAVRITTNYDTRKRGIPKEKEYLIGLGYQLRKALDPRNILSIYKTLKKKDRYVITKVVLKNFLQIGESASLSELTQAANNLFSTNKQKVDFAFIQVPNTFEPDIDSKEDILRARKMISMYSSNNITIQDCITKYNECLDKECKRITLIGCKVKNKSINYVKEEIEFIRMGEFFKSFYWHKNIELNYSASLFYDLQKACEIAYKKTIEKKKLSLKNK